MGNRLSRRERARLIKTAHLWLKIAVASADITVLFTEEVSRVLGVLGSYAGFLSTDLELAQPMGLVHWLRYRALPDGDGDEELSCALAWFEVLAEVEPDSVPELAAVLLQDSGDVLEEALASDDGAGLDRAIGTMRTMVAGLPAGYHHLPGVRTNLAVALQVRFERGGELADIGEAIELNKLALATVPDDGVNRVMYLTNLGAAFSTRFERTSDLADLDQAVQVLEQAAAVSPPDHPELATCLNNLGGAYLSRFRRGGESADLDIAVARMERAVALSPDRRGQSHAERLSSLVLARLARYELTGSSKELAGAIQAGEQAVMALPAHHPLIGRYSAQVGDCLLARFEREGRVADADRAVELLEAALAGTAGSARSGRQADLLARLGGALRMRFESSGSQADLEAAVRIGAEAVAAAPDDASVLSHLSVSLRLQFNQTGTLEDLETAIDLSRRVVAIVPDGARGKWDALTALAAVNRVRFEHTGELADIDAAIQACQQAIAAVPAGMTAEQAEPFAALAAASHARFARTQAPADLDTAVTAGKAAVAAVPDGHVARPRYLANLAGAFTLRFELSGETADLDAAVEAAERAAALTGDGYSGKARNLSNLAITLKKRFDRTRQPADLDAAVRAIEQATNATPDGHPDQAGMLFVLGTLLQARAEHNGNQLDLDAAADAARQGTNAASSPARHRINAAIAWAHACSAAGRWTEAASGYLMAVGLLSRLSPRWMGRSDQEGMLADFPNLGTAATACCIQAGMAQPAVEAFEQGRGVLLGHALDTRTDLTDLAETHPGLAERFAGLRDALDPAEPAGTEKLGDADPLGGHSAQAGARRRRSDQAAAFADLVTEIRAVPGFESFLAPPSIGQLRQVAADGPVVLVNAAVERSDALIVTGDGILEPVPLPGLSPDSLRDKAFAFFGAVNRWSDEDASPGEVSHEERLLEVLRWLWDMVTEPVLDRLGITGPPPMGPDGQPVWPRIWWCPSGVLSFLPLHASGHHEHVGAAAAETVLDRVVSSYTPTIRALAHARRSWPAARAGRSAATPSGSPRQSGLPGTGQLIAVAMDTTPGLGPEFDLPAVTTEIDMLRDLFPGSLTLFTGDAAGRRDVLNALPGARWAHFACHAGAQLQAPSANSLILSDWSRSLLTVTDVARLHLDNAELAFLSACSTGRGGLTVPDEAIHLGSAFQLAGFRNVIATLWQVEDRSAATIARDTYRKLAADGGADHAALALHAAVRAQRRRAPATPSSWAAHVHVGA